MSTDTPMSRRNFFTNLGRGAATVAVVGIVATACSSESEGITTSAPAPTPTTGATDLVTTTTTRAPQDAAPTSTEVPPPVDETAAVVWERANLGFVSAYVLARAGEAVIIDTGVAGSEGSIGDSLAAINLGWDDVSHVILTHRHNDHQGSLPAVIRLAANAVAYAGAADVPAIDSPRSVTPVGDGDSVFGLKIIDTPGHTPGHIAVLDPVGGLLVAGDSMNGSNGGVIGANPQFSPDMPAANASVKKLAQLTFGTVLFGHGEPIEAGASTLVVALAATL